MLNNTYIWATERMFRPYKHFFFLQLKKKTTDKDEKHYNTLDEGRILMVFKCRSQNVQRREDSFHSDRLLYSEHDVSEG